jgi:SAM-dependent methyltransferase
VARLSQHFDVQARTFDQRARLGQGVGRVVAAAVIEHGRVGPHDLLLELGAGTGAVGGQLAARHERYLGLDVSRPMLATFAQRLARPIAAERRARSLRPLLVQADCDQHWPVLDGAATVVFASRVVHLLEPRHVAHEAARVCRPGGHLLVGRVVRDPSSPRERLRREKQRRLAERGLEPRRGDAGIRRLLEACMARGAEALAPRVVATWTSRIAAERILLGWAALPGMGGIPIAPAVQTAILDELWAWARRELGDLRRPAPCDERYVLEGVRFGRAGDPRRPITMNSAWTMLC